MTEEPERAKHFLAVDFIHDDPKIQDWAERVFLPIFRLIISRLVTSKTVVQFEQTKPNHYTLSVKELDE